jgi:hypothetical protein
MQPQFDLVKLTDWTALLAALNIQVFTKALPARVTCPICRRSQLLIFHHFTLNSQWHSCEFCQQSGDLFELAARVWRISLKNAIIRCRQLRLIADSAFTRDTLTEYAACKKTQDKTNLVWRIARNGQLHQGDGQQLLRTAGWKASPTTSWKDSGISDILGCIDAKKFQTTLSETEETRANRLQMRDNVVFNPTTGKLLPGTKWGKVLLVPYYDVPHRIVGFQVYGRSMQLDKDKLYCCADSLANKNREAGIQLHNSLLSYTDDMLGMSNLDWYMRIQSKHLDNNPAPLPLFCWYNSAVCSTKSSWPLLQSQRLVLWADKLDAKTLLEAIRQNADITVCPQSDTSPQGLAKFFASLSPSDFVYLALEKAKEWPELLKKLARQDTKQLEELVVSLLAHPAELQILIDACDLQTAAQVRKFIYAVKPNRTVVFGNKTFEQRKDGLYLLGNTKQSKPTRVVNGRLKLSRLVWYPEAKEIDYIGQLHSGTRYVDFVVDKDTLLRDAINWLAETSLSAGLPIVTCTNKWARHLHDIALLFNQPVTELGFERVGWCDSKSSFILPSGKIDCAGKFTAHSIFRKTISTPGDLARTRTDKASYLHQLATPLAANQVFWSIYFELLKQILAPAHNETAKSILFIADAPFAIAAASNALAVPKINPLDYPIETHNWPTWIDGCIPYSAANPGSIKDTTLFVTTANWPQALGYWLLNKVKIFTVRRVTKMPDIEFRNLQWIALDYIKHVCKNKLFDPLRVPETFIDFVNDQCGVKIEYSDSWIYEYGHNGITPIIGRLVAWTLATGYTSMLPRDIQVRDNRNQDVIRYSESGLVYVPKTLVRKCLVDEGWSNPNIDAIGSALLSENIARGEEWVNGRLCWCLPDDWLCKFSNEERNKEQGYVAVG